MRSAWELEVLVNGEYTFFVNKETLLWRCGRLSQVYKETSSNVHVEDNTSLRLILHDLPGGAGAFEFIARFCYTEAGLNSIGACQGSTAQRTFSIQLGNVALLRCAADYLEMTEDYGEDNLIRRSESFLSSMSIWSLGDCISVLKSCEALLLWAEKAGIVQRVIDVLAVKISSQCSSLKNSLCNSPIEGCASAMSKSNNSWWCEGLSTLSMNMMERVVKAMVAQQMDNRQIGRVLLKYFDASLLSLGFSSLSITPWKTAPEYESFLYNDTQRAQCQILETVVELFNGLELASLQVKSLFKLRRIALAMNGSKVCRRQLEKMIASQLQKASLDDILVPRVMSPGRSTSLYDVDLVLRLVKQFLVLNEVTVIEPMPDYIDDVGPSAVCSYQSSSDLSSPLKMVGSLMDMYLAEIAPDICLKAAKFKELAELLPNYARDSHDGLYRAIDIYVQAHPHLAANEEMRLWKVLNFERLSFEGCKHVLQNRRIPARLSFQMLASQQKKFRAMVMEFYESKRASGSNSTSRCSLMDCTSLLRQNEIMRSHLQAMHEKVTELEGLCKRLRSQVTKSVYLSC